MRLLTVARQLARCALLPSFRTFARSTKRPPKPGDKYKLGESAEMKQLKMMILNVESKEEFEEAERMLYAQEDSVSAHSARSLMARSLKTPWTPSSRR